MLNVYSSGLLYCSVCTDIENREEIERQVNLANPTGISSLWRISDEPFRDGTPNPCQCNDGPGRKHYLMEC